MLCMGMTTQAQITGESPVDSTQKYHLFTSDEVLVIANKIKKMEYKLSIYDSLTIQYRFQLETYEKIIQTDSVLLKNMQQQEMLYREKELIYKQQIEDAKPKWYENKYLWFGIGVGLGIFIAR